MSSRYPLANCHKCGVSYHVGDEIAITILHRINVENELITSKSFQYDRVISSRHFECSD